MPRIFDNIEASLLPALQERLEVSDHAYFCVGYFKRKEVFRKHQSQQIDRVIYLINPVLRGWANYFRVGNSSRYFGYIKNWVEKKIRRHLMHGRKRHGFGME